MLSDQLISFDTQFLAAEHILYDKRNTVKRLKQNNIDLVAKKFKDPNILQSLIYAHVRPSKARRSFQNAKHLQQLNINTPTPIADIEYFLNHRLKQSYYLAQHFDHDFSLANVFSQKNEAIIKAFTRFTYNMHEAGVLHQDHNTENTLIKKNTNGYEFAIIDINRMLFKTLSIEERMYNFVRLTNDWSIMEMIAESYARFSSLDKNLCQSLLFKAKKRHLKKIKFKKMTKKIIGKQK